MTMLTKFSRISDNIWPFLYTYVFVSFLDKLLQNSPNE